MVKDMIAIVAAASPSRGIGYQGELPWKLPADMKHFKQVTTEPPAPGLVNAVVMGRKTWESIPKAFRPLTGRANVVLTRDPATFKNKNKDDLVSEGDDDHNKNVIVASSLEDAVSQLDDMDNLGSVYVIGGAAVYEEAVQRGLVNKIVYTEVSNLPDDAKFDAYFPKLNESEWIVQDASTASCSGDKENHNDGGTGSSTVSVDPKSGLSYRFRLFIRRFPDNTNADGTTTTTISTGSSSSADNNNDNNNDKNNAARCMNPEEMQYLDLCRDIITNGIRRGDRTGTGTLSKFGAQMRFSLRDGTLPLLTTKRTFWRGVAEELLWFISGNTNANDLAAKNVHIWDGNGSREFLDDRGLSHRDVGDLGPVYGFQWRHFGAKYTTMHADYTGQGVDQLADCIHKIKYCPEDRRIVLSAWNPADLDLMALPPCHMFCQFYVDADKNELSCQMYQRSADMGLGVPFNIASYALLTHMVAHVTGRKAGDFVHTIGDAHVYLNHVDALREQLKRSPRPFPTLRINPDKTRIDDFVYEDFTVRNYNPHKTIKMKMAV